MLLFQPDIPQNLGAAMRLCACLGVGLEVVEPCGFPMGDKGMRRAALDYGDGLEVRRHGSWADVLRARDGARLLLLTTGGAVAHTAFRYRADDVLVLGRESAGAPEEVHAAADARLLVPMRPGARSLNVVTAAALVLGEALRQTGGFPGFAGGVMQGPAPSKGEGT